MPVKCSNIYIFCSFTCRNGSKSSSSKKMAAVESAVLSNGYNGAQVNGHSYGEESDDKVYEEKPYSQKPQTKTVPQKGSMKSAPTFEGKSVTISTPEVKPAFKSSGHEEVSIFENGPDQILPADQLWTSEISGCVRLQFEESKGVASQPPISVPGLLHRTATNFPDCPALSHKTADGLWQDVSFKDYEQNVRNVAKAFLQLGLQRHRGVCIIGFNSPEWFYADLGAIYAGGIAVGMYTTNNAEACYHCLESSEANICVVEDDKQLQKILRVRDRLPELRAIIQYSGTPTSPGVMSWAEMMELGEAQDETQLEAALKKVAINECCTLVFTSGTEGKPKGVMLSHDNLTWDAFAAAKYLKLEEGVNSIVSFLPLSHIAAQLGDIFIPITSAAKTFFADSDALKGSLVKTLGETRPTVFLGVPRVFEKIQERMRSIAAQTTGVKKMIATWGKECCLQHHVNVMNGDLSEPYRYKMYRWLIFGRIKAALGLDRCTIFLSAAAPIATETKKYFMSIDIPVTDAFGMSECTGAHTLSRPDDFHMDSVGRAVCGTETKLDNPDEDGQGEICMRGRHVFMGYLKDPEKTKVALDDEGWLHSGDIGKVDEKGHLHITGRIKELLITAGGENVPPVVIEHVVKQELPCVSNAQLIGDKRKFLSILLTLKTEMDSESGAPLDQLTQDVKTWCRNAGCEVETVTDVLQGPKKEIMDAIQAGIDRANFQAVSNAQRIQKFVILPADFSIPTGELGPTLKLKRNVVYEKYADVIEQFYIE